MRPPILLIVLIALRFAGISSAAVPAEKQDLPYKEGSSLTSYEKDRCKLDLYLPPARKGFPTLVWLYGGGLTAGSKENEVTRQIARHFAETGIAIAVVDYRLSPRATFPAYIEDAAAAFAWVHRHIASYGGNPEKVFLGGHSAGAYLSSMVAMDPRYLQKLGLGPETLAGVVAMSGQMMTHFTVRAERKIDNDTIIADEAAPIYFTRAQAPPFLIIFGDHDWPARLEENQYFAAAQKSAGNTRIELRVFPDRTHGSIAGKLSEPGDPAAAAVAEFIERIASQRK